MGDILAGFRLRSDSMDSSKQSEKIVCFKCGASYDRLPAINCPRCREPLCRIGCDGCAKACAFRVQGIKKNKIPSEEKSTNGDKP